MHDEALARSVLMALRLEVVALEPIGLGLASDAWLVRNGRGASVLRIANDGGDAPPTYPMEHAMMTRLAAVGAPVPSPIAGDWDVEGWTGPPFSLTTEVAGTPLRPEAHDGAARAIAEFLRSMHGLRVEGFGSLTVIDGELGGTDIDLATGLAAWAQRPLWPLGDARLEDEPSLADRPELVARLEAHATTVRDALSRGPGVPVHSDLHEENILDADGSLSFIDFGMALIGPAAWEFAALGYFLGWPLADRTLAAYLDDPDDLARWHADASAFALCFGVYRRPQDRAHGFDEDDHNETFLHEALERLG
jgi:Ser/Thr protein kinase RdoA (MazF antagonist)